MTKPAFHPIEALRAKVPLSRPGDPGYAAATSIWARPSGPGPVAVAHCRTAADVREAVRAARKHGLPLSVRAGGHDWAGRALCTGVVIDLTPMRAVIVEEDRSAVRMGGGTLARDLFPVTDPIGRAVVTGTVGAVGMGGFTLGGGYGALIGRFGLALDNLLSAEVVLADGSFVVANDRSNPELFWALRGGGGNFGVVTGMRHRLHPLAKVYTGMILYPVEQAEAVLTGSAELLASAGDDLTAQVGFISGPSGEPMIFITPTWCGAPDEGEQRVAPLTRLGTPLVANLNASPPGMANTLFDAHIVNGLRVYMETRTLPSLSRGAIAALIDSIATRPSPGCFAVTHEFRGAPARVPVEATAFGLRSEHVVVELVAVTDSDSDAEAHRAWAKATSEALAPFARPGGYANFLVDDDPERVRASFGPNAGRLALAKRRYDPDNVFARAIPLPAHQTEEPVPSRKRA
ncbi:MAG TPA: FAD-binding oxidoreductase [Haliangiales bacterium]|nr:FAD-binding oxidoreductase [Haliangiales bacterium]